MWKLSLLINLFLLCLASLAAAQGSANRTSKWQTLNGDRPLVIARGGFSGLFPDSSSIAYSLALLTSLSNVLLWCDVQLTKDGAGICFPDLKLNSASDIGDIFKEKSNTYPVNGVPMQGWFSIDFTLDDLANIYLTQGISSRSEKFDGNLLQTLTVQDVAKEFNPPGLWLNVQHDAFFSQHNLSMRSFVISASRSVIISYISSPEVNFLRSILPQFKPSKTKLIFRFLGQEDVEPSTNLTYGSLQKNLRFVKTFASGILVPKSYIWPVDSLYLQNHTSLVLDAHKEGLEVFASDFANDVPFAYDYSYDPVSEYLYYIDNGNFSVDGVLSDFPVTPSSAIDCFAHIGRNASKQARALVISHQGASGDFPGCTDLAYKKAVLDGVDVLDCPVQMSKDGIPFCLGSINLIDNTKVAQSSFSNLSTTIPELKIDKGIFTFSLTWSQIQNLTLAIGNPWTRYRLFRNPKFQNAGKLMTLSDFLEFTKNTSVSGVLIGIENAAYLAEEQRLSVTDAVLDALSKAGYNSQAAKKVMIHSTNSPVLKKFKERSNYELVYEVDENIRDALNSTILDIKSFTNSVIVNKESIFPSNLAFVTGSTNVVQKLQAFGLHVYVQLFNNEFVSQSWDFFGDATVEINSFVIGAGIDGLITDFPHTAIRYRSNRCLGQGDRTPPYMSPVQPGSLLQVIPRASKPPAEAPNPVLTVEDISEPPLPPVSAMAPAPGNNNGSSPAAPLSPPTNGQPKVACAFLFNLAILIATLMLL